MRRDRFLNRSDELSRHLQLAAAKCGEAGWILILLDADDDCPASKGLALRQQAQALVPARDDRRRLADEAGRSRREAHKGAVLAQSLSPDGQTLASADKDGHLRLWDMATRQPLRDPLLRHAGPVLALAWAPDGSRIASAGWDRGVMISRIRPADWAALACALVRHNPPAADAGTPTDGCTAPNRP